MCLWVCGFLRPFHPSVRKWLFPPDCKSFRCLLNRKWWILAVVSGFRNNHYIKRIAGREWTQIVSLWEVRFRGQRASHQPKVSQWYMLSSCISIVALTVFILSRSHCVESCNPPTNLYPGWCWLTSDETLFITLLAKHWGGSYRWKWGL